MMLGKATAFNRDMNQINIARMDVLFQLVQVVGSMREDPQLILGALECRSDDSGGSQGELMAVRQAKAKSEALAGELSKKLRTLVQMVERVNVRYGA